MTLFIAFAGGLGAATRLILDGLIRARSSGRYPLATNIINISGSFLLGVVVSLDIGSAWQAIAGAGFLGGYTTFSTASFATARLAHDGRYVAALANGLGVLAAAIAAASLGFWIGSNVS